MQRCNVEASTPKMGVRLFCPCLIALILGGSNFDYLPPQSGSSGMRVACFALVICSGGKRKPRGYWENQDNLKREIGTFLERQGRSPTVLPTKKELDKSGRFDLSYAIRRNGGYLECAKRLGMTTAQHPKGYWKYGLAPELRSFAVTCGMSHMPSGRDLANLGRNDIVDAILAVGGYRNAAKIAGLGMRGDHEMRVARDDSSVAGRVARELRQFLHKFPCDMRSIMPTSVVMVEAGREDLANKVRDCGGWVYYARQLGLRFGMKRKSCKFWWCKSNLYNELHLYMISRYGGWHYPLRKSDKKYIPTLNMLKRDGRLDIAFAIERYHGGEEVYARRHGMVVANDPVDVACVEGLLVWATFERELMKWVRHHGGAGIMPSTDDFVGKGRHDLIYGTLHHGGRNAVAKRAGLVVCNGNWIGKWLALQAASLGNTMCDTSYVYSELDGAVVIEMERDESLLNGWKKRRKLKREVCGIDMEQLNRIRERFKHIVHDDIIVV